MIQNIKEFFQPDQIGALYKNLKPFIIGPRLIIHLIFVKKCITEAVEKII